METWRPQNCAVIGATGGLGAAFVKCLAERESVDTIWCLSRDGSMPFSDDRLRGARLDYDEPETIVEAASLIEGREPLDLVIVATGLLHDEDQFQPEKSMRDLDVNRLSRAFQVNAVGPVLVARSFLPLMRRQGKSVFAALSARVGSISDNQIGGWYGYRAAKAGLNQFLKTASIEHQRRWKEGMVVGLHPGTVDTDLSQPFQRNVAEGKLFTPVYSATSMLSVLERLAPTDTGKVFAFDGTEVPA